MIFRTWIQLERDTVIMQLGISVGEMRPLGGHLCFPGQFTAL